MRKKSLYYIRIEKKLYLTNKNIYKFGNSTIQIK